MIVLKKQTVNNVTHYQQAAFPEMKHEKTISYKE